MKKNICTLLSTYCLIGNIKYAPGTFGSLFTIPLFFLVNYLILHIDNIGLNKIIISYLLLIMILFVLSFWAIKNYLPNSSQKDPKEVVLDEVIGQLIAYIMLFIYIYSHNNGFFNIFLSGGKNIFSNIIINFLPFIFFRVFDISKPNLVGYFDKNIEGALGIIMDDVVAGIYSGVVSILITYFLI